MTKDIEREALVAEIELFIAKAMKAYVVESWADSYQNTSPFAHVINDRNEVWWMKTQAHQLWQFWQAAKAQAVPGWISVEDSLPPVDETVLVCWDYAPDIEPEKEYTTIDENLDEYWPNCQDEPPTHWMPLPKVVKAQEPAND